MQPQELRHQLKRPSLPHSFWYSTALVAFCLVTLISLGIGTQSSSLFQLIMTTAVTLTPVLSFALSWGGSRRRAHRSPGQPFHPHLLAWLPVIFSTALLFQLIASFLYAYTVAHHLPLSPSWGDAVMLAMYPLLMLGVLGLPTTALSGRARLRILLDSVLVIVTLLILSWYFLLGPTLLLETGGNLELVTIIRLAHPSLDLLVMSCVVVLLMQLPHGPFRLPASLLCVAFALYVLADSVFQYQLLHGSPGTQSWFSLGWVIGMLLTALAIQSIRWALAGMRTGEQTTCQLPSLKAMSIGRALLPYALVPVVLIVDFSAWSTGRNSMLALGTYGSSVLLLALIFLKQVLALREIHWLNGGLEHARQELHENNEALQQANRRLEALATTDPLTGLLNHRAILTQLEKEIDRARRFDRSCSVLFFDLDHFKALNDGYGHSTGDEALCAFGHLLCQKMRSMDTVGRWGGEEFIALLPETTPQEARVLAERVREAVSQATFAIGGGLHFSCSIGIASYPTHANTLEAVVNAADQAMYAAKRLGRNQVRCIDESIVGVVLASDTSEEGREEGALRGTVEALLSLLEQRERSLGEHCSDVANLVDQLACQLEVSSEERRMVKLAGQLHDIGKIGVPDAILLKPASLTEDEWCLMKTHSAAGAQVVEHIPSLRPLAAVIRAHHERWDGTGYPDRMQGKAIPLASRMIAVVDAYTTMIMGRPYQQACSTAQALKELRRCAGTQFDPEVVEALLALLHEQAPHAELVAQAT